MSRTLLMLMVVLLVVLCQPRPAEAMFWAWLEKWSGPGPFRAKPFRTMLFTMCIQPAPVRRGPVAPNEDPSTGWTERLRLTASPVAMNNAYHKVEEERALWIYQRLTAESKLPITPLPKFLNFTFANAPAPVVKVTKRDILRRLLASPSFTTLARQANAVTPFQPVPMVPPSPGVAAPPMPLPQPEAPAVQPMQRVPQAPGIENVDFFKTLTADLPRIYVNPATELGPGHPHERLLCGYFDLGSFEADADTDPERGFPELGARLYDFGPSARVHDGIDIGGGIGWVRFTGAGVNLKRGAFTPLRVIIRPIVLAVPDDLRKGWMGVFSFYWKETYVWGELTGRDFGVDNGWSEKGELIRSFGVTLDLGALIPKKWGIPLAKARP